MANSMQTTGTVSTKVMQLNRSVLIADSVRLTRESLFELLTRRGVAVTASSADAESVVAALDGHAIDLVVCNAATVDLRAVVPAVHAVRELPVVALSVGQTVADVALCAELGLAGFVLADDSLEDLLDLIETASFGEAQCPAGAVPMLLTALRRLAATADSSRLTSREHEIAVLLLEGMANKEIAKRLGITARTVKNHLHHVYDKLGLHSRGEVAALLRDSTQSNLLPRSVTTS